MRFLSPHAYCIHCPSHSPWFEHSYNMRWRVQFWNLKLCSFQQPPVTFSLLGPNILLIAPFPNKHNISQNRKYQQCVTSVYLHSTEIIGIRLIYTLIFYRQSAHSQQKKCVGLSTEPLHWNISMCNSKQELHANSTSHKSIYTLLKVLIRKAGEECKFLKKGTGA